MKCGACGAIGSSSHAECEFCGNKLSSSNERSIVSGGNGGLSGDQISGYVKDSFSLIQDLSKSPSGGFKIVPFFFPVPYLWGYGAKDNAKSVAAVLLVPQLLASLLVLILGFKISSLVALAQLGWNIYVNWMVSTRISLLAKQEGAYDWGQGIIALIVFAVLGGIISSLGSPTYYYYF